MYRLSHSNKYSAVRRKLIVLYVMSLSGSNKRFCTRSLEKSEDGGVRVLSARRNLLALMDEHTDSFTLLFLLVSLIKQFGVFDSVSKTHSCPFQHNIKPCQASRAVRVYTVATDTKTLSGN